ncbi:MAG: hypothetical protein U1E53_07395 [Dongiaceae bacterium]
MAAEQRHRGAAVLGDGDHRRLAPLVGQQRRQRADQDAGGAQPDDRLAGGEQRAQMRRDLVEAHRGVGDPRRVAVQHGPGHGLQDALGGRPAALAEQQDGGHRQASPRRCSSTIEK